MILINAVGRRIVYVLLWKMNYKHNESLWDFPIVTDLDSHVAYMYVQLSELRSWLSISFPK